jgi:hypothetical protein
MGAFTMGMLRVLLFVLLMGVCALAESPTYGVGPTPSAEEIRVWDVSIGPTGEELPPGRGTAKEGAKRGDFVAIRLAANPADPPIGSSITRHVNNQ